MTEAEQFKLDRATMLRDGARKQCDRMRVRLFALRDDLKDLLGQRLSDIDSMLVNDTAQDLLDKHFPMSPPMVDTTDKR